MDFDGEIKEVDIDKVCFYGIAPGGYSGYSKKRPKKKKNSSIEASSAGNSQNPNEQPEFKENSGISESEGNDSEKSDENDDSDFLNADIDDNSVIDTESSDIPDSSGSDCDWNLDEDENEEFDEQENSQFSSHKPKLHLPNFHRKGIFSFFEHFFPVDFINEVVLPCTNAEGKYYDPKFKPVSLGEFHRWIGLWCMMLVVRRPGRRCYWASVKSSLPFTVDFGIYMTDGF